MTSSRHHLILILLYAVTTTRGDSGDDFSNNLFTDLAPILALFGERVTMQFLSQSMGWADCILLAMAPLGIITIIVSAIRVGGPSFLKALIGRSTENIHTAEMELMSSTSDEVCELWNGTDIVRCQGSAPVLEFICIMPKETSGENSSPVPTEVKIMELDKYTGRIVKVDAETVDAETIDAETVDENGRGTLDYMKLWWDWAMTWRRPDSPLPTTENARPKHDESYIAVLHHTKNPVPNITINRAENLDRTELRIAAFVGIIIQVGVLVFLALTTYLPALRHTFLKDGRPVADYAFPLTASGTVVLALGMLFCAHVVDCRTSETTWIAEADVNAQVVWLQREAIVSDQRFYSVALNRTKPLTIFRKSGREEGQSLQKIKKIQIKTIIGTCISLVGFITQFIGIRGMHWSAPIAQLVAVALVTALRAWVRRGLITGLRSHSLPTGHELDWFALTLGSPSESLWYPAILTSQESLPCRDQSETSNSISSTAPSSMVEGSNLNSNGSPSVRNLYWIPLCITNKKKTPFYDESKLEESEDSPSKTRAGVSPILDRTTAQGLLRIRNKLANISDTVNWHNPIAAVAHSLAEAIRIVMNTFAKGESRNYEWVIPVHCSAVPKMDTVRLKIYKNAGRWIIAADELEAILSLWVYSLKMLQSKESRKKDENSLDDISEQRRELSTRPALRIVGRFSEKMLRDLALSLPFDMSFISEADTRLERPGRVQTFPGYDVHGHTWPSYEFLAERSSWRCSSLDFRAAATRIWDRKPIRRNEDPEKLLVTEMSGSMESLCAIDLFASFVWATIQLQHGKIKENLRLLPSMPPGTKESDGWVSLNLRNSALDELARNVESAGLMTRYQAYLSIVPALSHLNLFGGTAMDHVRAEAVRYESLREWHMCSAAYVALFTLVRNSDSFANVPSQIAVASLLEHLRTNVPVDISDFDYMCELNRWSPIEDFAAITSLFTDEFGVRNRDIIDAFRELYQRQKREYYADALGQALSAFTDNSPTHNSQSNADEIANIKDIGCMYDSKGQKHNKYPEHCCCTSLPLDQKDCMDWTPLHYESARGCPNIQQLFFRLDDEDILKGMALAPDLRGLTPLHYACRNGHFETVKILLQHVRSSTYDKQGTGGISPLHMAACSGSAKTVELLLKEGVNASLKDSNGMTALHYAAQYGHVESVEKLKEDIKQIDNNRRTALHYAARYGRVEVIKTIIIIDEEMVDIKDRQDSTALHLAAERGHADAVKALLKAGANPLSESRTRGSLPIHLACTRSSIPTVEALLKAAPDTWNKLDGHGKSPAERARYYGKQAVIERLREHYENTRWI